MAKITFQKNDSFKSMLNESYNMFITDYLMDVGETYVGQDTDTFIEIYKASLVTLKRLYKKLTTCTVRCTFDTDSDEFKMFDSYACYVINKIEDEFLTFRDFVNREALEILRTVLIYSNVDRKMSLNAVNELIRECEEEEETN